MKKVFIYATIGALSITALTPSAVYAAGTYNISGQRGKVVVIGGNISGNQECDQNVQNIPGMGLIGNENWSSILENIQNMIQGSGTDCPVLPDWNPGGNSQPDVDYPENDQPENDKPENDKPENDQLEEDSSEDGFAAEVARLVNEERAKAGLAPLTINNRAASAAQTRAKEITTSFSHTRPNGSSFSTALDAAGVRYSRSGENIAYGQRTPQAVMNAWMNSSGHRANILNPNFTEIGVGHYTNAAGVSYWVQLFIN